MTTVLHMIVGVIIILDGVFNLGFGVAENRTNTELLGDLVVDGRTIACHYMNSIHEAHVSVQVAESCEHATETLVCIKGGEFRDKLSEYQFHEQK